MASRRKLPNLKISVDNTQSSDDSDVEVAISDASGFGGDDSVEDKKARSNVRLEDGEVHEGDEHDVLSIGGTEPTERRFLSRSALRQNDVVYGPRIYENKTGNFVTGVDITSEEASVKREKRARRFGTLSTPKQPITDVDIKNLYKSLGMSTDTLDQDVRGWRTEAIMLRGTENMSTKDVFDYFSEYAPKGVEWIDDFSCNVLWQDKLTPARALLKLSSSMEEVGATEKPLEVDGQHFHGISPLNRDKQKDNPEGVTEANKIVTNEISDSDGNAVSKVPERANTQATPAADDRTHNEQVLNVLMDDAMELDYDDNLDLTEEDPIDKALSTWANFSQNKKVKAEHAKEMERKRSEKHTEKERISKKEKTHQEVVIKEEKDFSEKSGTRNNETGKKSVPEFQVHDQTRPVSSKTHAKNSSSKLDRSKDKSKAAEVRKPVTKKRNEKMDTSGESDSDSSSSRSSSSGSRSSLSSSSGSSSSSDSDSESGSESSASSVDTIKAKQRKSRERRDKEHDARKNARRAAPPPILPQAREKVDIPWPPGWWRLGIPYHKAKYLFMRYAMKADKKLPGAEKRSQYYVKHGNPNFGGIVGFISKSRKRRLRNVDKEEPVEEEIDSLDVVKKEENVEGAQSRLAGRVGTRGEVGGSRRRDAEDETDKPKLKAGRDLRDLLNRDVSAIQHDPEKTEANNDSDDEMDYGAELERLMGDDAPPVKKRFMRMHADDEEEKIQAKRLLSVQKDTSRWPRGDYSSEDEVEEVDDFEPEEPLRPRRKEWVDYDNVEDDDPFNLFGTSRRGPPKNVVDNDDNHSGEENEDNGDYRRTFRRDDDRPGRDVRQRLGTSDLRAKIQGLKRVNNRTW
ncbi:hypothetical protein BsWGS_08499 [Bradybaena similaris]